MNIRRFFLLGIAGFALSACHSDPERDKGSAHMDAYRPDSGMQADLAKAASLRIFFGHQSVGGNVIEGLSELRSLAGDTVLRIVHDPDPHALPPAFLAETRIGRNGDPMGKLKAFRSAVDSAYGGGLDLALVKICYVDLERDTHVDPDSLFAAYRKTVFDLEAAHPGLVVIPVTSPLTSADFGARGRMDQIKGKIKRWLGVSDDNARRAIFNVRLREAFRDRTIFDIAAVESTRPDGSRVRYGRGDAMEGMAAEYTVDGGHLNELGRKIAARAFLRALAEAAGGRNGPRKSIGASTPNS
jgi:hypothetical protein